MRIYFKNVQEFRVKVIKKGFTLAGLSRELGKTRQHLNKAIQVGAIGAESAKKLCVILKEDYDDIFEIK